MNSRGFNHVLFSSGDRKKRQKKEQTRRVKRWQKAGRGQKAHCKGQKCPRKGGERKESHHWLVPRTHCKRRGVQPRMTDVPGHCFPSSLLSASCSGSGIPRDGLRLWESFNTPRLSPRVHHRHPGRAQRVYTQTLKVGLGDASQDWCQKLSLVDTVPTGLSFTKLCAYQSINTQSLLDTEQLYVRKKDFTGTTNTTTWNLTITNLEINQK